MKKVLSLLENKSAFGVFSILWKMISDLSYSGYVVKYFEYAGFVDQFSYSAYILGWFVFSIGLFLSPKILNKPSDLFISLFFLIVVTPSLTFISYSNVYDYTAIIVLFLSYTFMVFFCNNKIVKSIRIPYIKDGEKIFKFFSISLVIYLIFWYIISGAISNFNLDLSKVYDFREINADLTNVGFLAYLNSWVYQVFTVALMSYALLKKNYISFFGLCLVQVFFFGINGHKSILFTPVIIYIIYFYFSFTKALSILPFLLLILIGGLFWFSFYEPYSIFPSMFIRRTFFVPSHLTFTYFDFFSNHSFNYWSNSVMKYFMSEIYPDGVSKEIGKYLNTETNANNGFISSGFAQFGILGVAIYVVVFSYLIKICDYLSYQVGSNWFSICLLIVPVRNIYLSSDLLTSLLTHGFLIAILVLVFARSAKNNRFLS